MFLSSGVSACLIHPLMNSFPLSNTRCITTQCCQMLLSYGKQVCNACFMIFLHNKSFVSRAIFFIPVLLSYQFFNLFYFILFLSSIFNLLGMELSMLLINGFISSSCSYLTVGCPTNRHDSRAVFCLGFYYSIT